MHRSSARPPAQTAPSIRWTRLLPAMLLVALTGCPAADEAAPPQAAPPPVADAGGPASEAAAARAEIDPAPPTDPALQGLPAEPNPPGDRPTPLTRESAWTAGIVGSPPAPDRPVQLSAVRTGTHPDYDRVVFEFAPGGGPPGYHVEYIDHPVRDCGAGRPVPLAGDGWLEIRMQLALAHDPDTGRSDLPRHLVPELPVILEARQTCDFEGRVTWVLGVRSPNRYRVTLLEDPPRIAVDVRH